MDYEHYSADQERIEYEIENNPELQRNELNPSVARVMCEHTKVYKTLATVGDFHCKIWYYDDDYDPSRTTQGGKRIHIVPSSDDFITEHSDINYFFNTANDKWSEGVVFVNPIIRRNGVKFTSNNDLKDCVKYMTGVSAHYGASEIIVIDMEDNNAMYDMSYDSVVSKIYSDVSNNVYEDFTSGPVGNGSLNLYYTQKFQSGGIPFSDLKSELGGGNSISGYYRGGAVGDISLNTNVPTSGVISFSNFRTVTTAVAADCNGNWQHLQARYEVFTGDLWQSTLKKTLNLNGNVGGASGNPALRFNTGGQGDIEVYVNNTTNSPCVRGYSGEGGDANKGNGKTGYVAMHVSSPIKMSNDHKNNRVKGGGGGGGGGGKGGKGGGGGHGGGRRCRGWFCNSSYRVCSNNGGQGGNGGAGGVGGRGAGYYWNGNNAFIDIQTASSRNGAGGGGGQGGSSRGGGTGGNGGGGGQGGAFESNGQGGGQGGTGAQGGGDQQGCGYRGSRSGQGGQGGGGAGGNNGKIQFGSGGSISNI